MNAKIKSLVKQNMDLIVPVAFATTVIVAGVVGLALISKSADKTWNTLTEDEQADYNGHFEAMEALAETARQRVKTNH